MSGLVKEGEPELIVCFVAEAELNKGFGRGEPARGAADSGAGQLGHESDRYSCIAAKGCGFRASLCNRGAGQSFDFGESGFEGGFVELCAAGFLRLEFAPPQPCGQVGRVACESWGV